MTNQDVPASPAPASPASCPPDYEDEIDLLDLLQVLLKRKKMIFWTTFCAGVLSIIVSLLLPKMYTATARILPPQEPSSGFSSLLSQSGGLGTLAGSLMGVKSTSDLYVGMLQSRTVADRLIEQFDLKELYQCEYLADVYRALADVTDISASKTDQIISVSVTDKDPQRAAAMANTYVDMLDRINRSVNITAAYRKRTFLEERLKEAKIDLTRSEQALKEFQEKYKIVSIEDQAKAAIEGAARIKGEIIVTQTELEVLKEFGTERQNEAIMLKSKIDELQKQLGRIERGAEDDEKSPAGPDDGDASDFYLPFNELPELGMQLFRLIREAKIQEKVFELMTTQYELAKLEEARDVTTIQVLDEAVPPDKKSKPKRSLIVILCTFMAGFGAVFTAFALEYVERIKREDPEKFRQLKQGFSLRKPGKRNV